MRGTRHCSPGTPTGFLEPSSRRLRSAERAAWLRPPHGLAAAPLPALVPAGSRGGALLSRRAVAAQASALRLRGRSRPPKPCGPALPSPPPQGGRLGSRRRPPGGLSSGRPDPSPRAGRCPRRDGPRRGPAPQDRPCPHRPQPLPRTARPASGGEPGAGRAAPPPRRAGAGQRVRVSGCRQHRPAAAGPARPCPARAQPCPARPRAAAAGIPAPARPRLAAENASQRAAPRPPGAAQKFRGRRRAGRRGRRPAGGWGAGHGTAGLTSFWRGSCG